MATRIIEIELKDGNMRDYPSIVELISKKKLYPKVGGEQVGDESDTGIEPTITYKQEIIEKLDKDGNLVSSYAADIYEVEDTEETKTDIRLYYYFLYSTKTSCYLYWRTSIEEVEYNEEFSYMIEYLDSIMAENIDYDIKLIDIKDYPELNPHIRQTSILHFPEFVAPNGTLKRVKKELD